MTDRHIGYLVTLDRSIRSDDAEVIISAIKMIKGVAEVKPLIDSWERQIAKTEAEIEIKRKLFEVFKE